MNIELTGTYRGITYNRDKLGSFYSPISHEQAHNLIDLADILRKIPPPNFDMKDYGNVQHRNLAVAHGIEVTELWSPLLFFRLGQNLELAIECGTSCCAIGTAAFYDIGGIKNSEGWVSYSNRVFGVGSNSWKWCFGGEWCNVDNDADGAAARILYMLVHGVEFLDDIMDDPDNENYMSSIYNLENVDRYSSMMLTEILPKNPVPGYNQEQP